MKSGIKNKASTIRVKILLQSGGRNTIILFFSYTKGKNQDFNRGNKIEAPEEVRTVCYCFVSSLKICLAFQKISEKSKESRNIEIEQLSCSRAVPRNTTK